MESISTESHVCVICGKEFVPKGTDTQCCSPICRTTKIMREFEQRKKDAESVQRENLDRMERPPRFNLKERPKERAEWFMGLPQEYKSKFVKFLQPQELEYARAIEQKRLTEDRLYTGFFVKKGKIVEVRGTNTDAERENAEDGAMDMDGEGDEE